MSNYIDIIVTLILGIAGLYLGYSLKGQLALKKAEKRMEAYADLWSAMRNATPTRLTSPTANPLNEKERHGLFKAFVDWYYDKGNGMLLGGSTRNLFNCVKDNLICKDEDMQPEKIQIILGLNKSLTDEEREKIRGKLAIRQLSLLRTRMKADLAVYGDHYFGKLKNADKEFLISCGERLWQKPWRQPLLKRRSDESETT